MIRHDQIFPQSTKMPFISTIDAIKNAVSDIGKFLKKTGEATPIE